MPRRSMIILLPAFSLVAVLLGGLFILVAESGADALHRYSLVGGAIIGLLVALSLNRWQAQPESFRRTFRWPVFLGIFFGIRASSLLGEWIGGRPGIIIGFCTAVVLAAACWYLDRLALPQKRNDGSPARLVPVRRRRAAQIAVWSLIAIEALAVTLRFPSRISPCSSLDLPRRISGCISRLNHSLPVRSVSYAPNGELIAVGSGSNVYLWSIPDNVLRRTLPSRTGLVSSVAISPNGEVVASASWDGTIQLWRIADGSLLHTLSGHTASVWDIAFAPDGFTLASASIDNTIRLWRVADGTLLSTLEHPNGAQKVAFAPDGQTLASTGGIDTLRLWNVQDGALLRTLRTPTLIESIAFSPDGTLIASGDWNNTIRLWRVQDGSLIQTLDGHTDHVVSLAFSPDGSLLASVGDMDDRIVRLWRVADGTLLRSYDIRLGVDDIAFGPDGNTLAIASFDGAYVWRIE